MEVKCKHCYNNLTVLNEETMVCSCGKEYTMEVSEHAIVLPLSKEEYTKMISSDDIKEAADLLRQAAEKLKKKDINILLYKEESDEYGVYTRAFARVTT